MSDRGMPLVHPCHSGGFIRRAAAPTLSSHSVSARRRHARAQPRNARLLVRNWRAGRRTGGLRGHFKSFRELFKSRPTAQKRFTEACPPQMTCSSAQVHKPRAAARITTSAISSRKASFFDRAFRSRFIRSARRST